MASMPARLDLVGELVERRADQHRHLRGHGRRGRVERVARQHAAVDDGGEARRSVATSRWQPAGPAGPAGAGAACAVPPAPPRAGARAAWCAVGRPATPPARVRRASRGQLRRVLGLRTMRRPDPLCTAARWNSPLAAGIASSVLTFAPPPDCPKMVTLPGSPPKLPMLSRTQSRAATMSSIPTLAEEAYRSP